MPNLPAGEEERVSRIVPAAMIIFGFAAVLVGGADPHGARLPQALTPDQLELVRADHVAGYPAPSAPDNPPRGPGA